MSKAETVFYKNNNGTFEDSGNVWVIHKKYPRMLSNLEIGDRFRWSEGGELCTVIEKPSATLYTVVFEFISEKKPNLEDLDLLIDGEPAMVENSRLTKSFTDPDIGYLPARCPLEENE